MTQNGEKSWKRTETKRRRKKRAETDKGKHISRTFAEEVLREGEKRDKKETRSEPKRQDIDRPGSGKS